MFARCRSADIFPKLLLTAPSILENLHYSYLFYRFGKSIRKNDFFNEKQPILKLFLFLFLKSCKKRRRKEGREGQKPLFHGWKAFKLQIKIKNNFLVVLDLSLLAPKHSPSITTLRISAFIIMSVSIRHSAWKYSA